MRGTKRWLPQYAGHFLQKLGYRVSRRIRPSRTTFLKVSLACLESPDCTVTWSARYFFQSFNRIHVGTFCVHQQGIHSHGGKAMRKTLVPASVRQAASVPSEKKKGYLHLPTLRNALAGSSESGDQLPSKSQFSSFLHRVNRSSRDEHDRDLGRNPILHELRDRLESLVISDVSPTGWSALPCGKPIVLPDTSLASDSCFIPFTCPANSMMIKIVPLFISFRAGFI